MRIENTNKLTSAVRIALAVGTAFTANAAFAQDADNSSQTRLETVTVTGSRIRSVDVETSQPVFTVSQADIQKTGLTNVGDILSHLTVAGPRTFSKAAVLTSNPEQGGEYVNLFNLGEQRTLVLVNGKRWATSLAGFTDISTIPSSMIERIEILKDGASAIYGSDAVAGVVNIILKDRYSGAEGSVYYGQNDGDDGVVKQYDFTAGTSTDKASVVFGATYKKQDPVWACRNQDTCYTYGPNHASSGLSGTGPWGRFRVKSSSNAGPTGSTYVINHTGTWDGIGQGADSRNLGNYHVGQTVDDYYNPPLQMNLAGSGELKSAFTSVRYDLADWVQFKGTALYSERSTVSQVAGYPLNSLSQPTFPVYVDANSYYNPIPGSDLFFYRRTIELPRITNNNVKSYHFDGGFEGAFDFGGHSYNWDVGFNYNKYDASIQGSGNLNLSNLKKALGPSFLNSNGVVQCGTAAAPISLDACVPFDILGGPSASTPAALAYINAPSNELLGITSKEFTANITGPLFTGWAGDIGAAVGYEHRQISGFDHLDGLVKAGLSTDLSGGNTDASYSTNEFFAELNVPLLKDLPGAKELSLDVAARYSDYSTFGNTTNPKFSLAWRPMDDLLVRGTYGKGLRAPTIDDLRGGGSQSFDYYTDPCDARFGAAASNPAIAAKCAAQGLPANFRQLASTGLPISAPNTQGTTPFNAGVGNDTLQPEKSTSKTAGFVYSPQWIDGLSLSADWYDIKITNSITALSANYVLNQCYTGADPSFCTQFSRDPVTGQVINLSRGNRNTGYTQTEGWNFGFTYRLPETSFGVFAASFDGNYLKKYEYQATNNSEAVNYVGQWSFPRWRANAALDWSLGNFNARWAVRYQGAFRDQCWDNSDPSAPVECSQPNFAGTNWLNGNGNGGIGANRIGAIVFNDVNVGYNLPWKANIQAGVNNVFDRKRPITYTSTNSSSALIDAELDTDRFFYVRYNQKF